MVQRLSYESFCPGNEQIHVKDTLLRGRYRTFLHCHDFHEFFVVRSGVVLHHINDTTEELHAGALCLVVPDDEHCFECGGSGTRARFTNVAVSADIHREALSVMPLAPRRQGLSPHTLPRTPSWLLGKIERASRDIDAWGPGEQALQRMLATSLLLDVLAEVVIATERDRSGAGAATPPWLRRAMRAMERRENYQAGLPRFVELCGKSQEHVTRTLGAVYGHTPTAFINQRRLREAARLLRDTDEPVMRVALQVGFGNMSHFLDRFRRTYGCAPRQYRRRNRMVIDPVDPAPGVR